MNVPKFRGIIAEKGKRKIDIARAIGVNPSTFYRKLSSGGASFTVGEIQRMAEFIPLTEEEATSIFLS